MKICIVLLIISIVCFCMASVCREDYLDKRLQVVEKHLNIAGQKIQDLDYEIAVLTDLQKAEK